MPKKFRLTLLSLTLLALSSCGSIDFDGLSDQGRFEGSVLVVWVGENESGSGDGKFVYVPFPGRELKFIRDVRNNSDATLETIVPGPIYTDGGSVPRVAQPFKGFSPWGYAPAYMIHDWLFVAKKCNTDGMAEVEERPVGQMPFKESAEIMGEAIKALIRQEMVGKNDVAPGVISSAVAGPISRSIWFQTGQCQENRLTTEHEDLIDDFIQRRGARLRTQGVLSPDRTGDEIRVVGVVEF
ncbi:MAG: hypothetical protein AAF088_07775 [Pseudomonadota bacterium]